MLPSEVAAIHYPAPENQSPYPTNFAMMQNTIPSFHFSSFPTSFPTSQPSPPLHEFTPQYSSSCLSNNSTSDEAEEEHQASIIDQRKQRRMISNRESARRSRMRKQKHLDELMSQVVRLSTENRSLVEKVNHAVECHDMVVQENARLKEEASNLREMLAGLQIGSPYPGLTDLEEVTCNTAHFRAQVCFTERIVKLGT